MIDGCVRGCVESVPLSHSPSHSSSPGLKHVPADGRVDAVDPCKVAHEHHQQRDKGYCEHDDAEVAVAGEDGLEGQ